MRIPPAIKLNQKACCSTWNTLVVRTSGVTKKIATPIASENITVNAIRRFEAVFLAGFAPLPLAGSFFARSCMAISVEKLSVSMPINIISTRPTAPRSTGNLNILFFSASDTYSRRFTTISPLERLTAVAMRPGAHRNGGEAFQRRDRRETAGVCVARGEEQDIQIARASRGRRSRGDDVYRHRHAQFLHRNRHAGPCEEGARQRQRREACQEDRLEPPDRVDRDVFARDGRRDFLCDAACPDDKGIPRRTAGFLVQFYRGRNPHLDSSRLPARDLADEGCKTAVRVSWRRAQGGVHL